MYEYTTDILFYKLTTTFISCKALTGTTEILGGLTHITISRAVSLEQFHQIPLPLAHSNFQYNHSRKQLVKILLINTRVQNLTIF